LARQALHSAIAEGVRELEQRAVALYSGATGVALAAVDVADCLGDSDLRVEALRLARKAAEQLDDTAGDVETDLISGVAGTVIGLLAIARRTHDRRLVAVCKDGGARLLLPYVGERCEDAYRRRAESAASAPALCGLGHGMSGVAWALTELALAAKTPAVLRGAEMACLYERSWFSREWSNWPDLRDPPNEKPQPGPWPGWTVAWCHGAVGIGAVRWRMYEASNSLAALAEASAAINATRLLVARRAQELGAGQVADPCLCHGLAGAAELFLLAFEITRLEDHRRAARRVGELCLKTLAANNGVWPTGLTGGVNVPGLMLGLAGVGVTMLRLHDVTSASSPLLAGRNR
jgi:lantibiotic modifying enzyme